jgi:parallel beta-helix repeat protein
MKIRQYLKVGHIIYALSLVGVIFNVPISQGETYYVAHDGNDSNAGTETEPFRTMGRGVRVLTPGDTLYVREGTYEESFFDSIPSGDSWDAPVTIAALSDETVTIRPNPGAEQVFVFQGADTHYIIVDGFIMDAANVSDDVIKITYESDPTDVAHSIRITNSELKDGPYNGILVMGGNNEFTNLRIHDNGVALDGHGLYIASADNLIEGCEIHDNGGWGVHVYDEYANAGMVNDNIVRNNKIYRNGVNGRGAGIILSSGSGNQAYDNEIWENAGGGIDVDYGASDTEVRNNTIYSNGQFGIYIGSGSFNSIIENNDIYDNNGPSILDFGSETTILP